jgi:hypothetical protein
MKNLAVVTVIWFLVGFGAGAVTILANVNVALAATGP